MDIGASYGISKARYEGDGNRLLMVEIHKIERGVLSPKRVWPRRNVMDILKRGTSVTTIRADGNGGYRVLEKVLLVGKDGRPFLRVDGDSALADHLGNIPDL